ncbi:ribosomal protein L25/Gln-tRNA synthetase [Tribonema minus]|uniref:Ribosomal protein L25/Gln-tRNA synthetase n=1 Tax=Tribonema minus TaxID=303371 RepID=A0A835YIH0_9STRA|nr:ribosomal protein L25/Gln-tRNA synthetase [Tribonema minus]
MFVHRVCCGSLRRRTAALALQQNVPPSAGAAAQVRCMSSHFPDESRIGEHSRVLHAVTRDPLGGSKRSAELREATSHALESQRQNKLAASRVFPLGAATRPQRAGLIPGVIYGKGLDGTDSKIMMCVPERSLQKEMRQMQESFQNVPYLVSVDGADPADAELVFPAYVEINKLNDRFQTVNWLRYRVGRPLSVPMRLVNEELSLSMRRGAWVQKVERRVDILISSMDPASIPKYIDVDLTGVKAGDKIDAKYLVLPPGVQLFRPEQPFKIGWSMGTVRGKKLPKDAESDSDDEDAA